MPSQTPPYNFDPRSVIAAIDGPAGRRVGGLEPAQQRSVILWLCWRGLWRWQNRMARGLPNPDFGGGPGGDPQETAAVARAALVAMGEGDVDPAELKQRFGPAVKGYQDGPMAMSLWGQPVLDAIHGLLSCRRDEAIPRPVLIDALTALDSAGASELETAMQQLALAERPARRAGSGLGVGILMVLLHVLAVGCVLAFGFEHKKEVDVTPAVVAVLVAPAVLTGLRTPFPRRRFITFVISGLLAYQVINSSTGWLLVFGIAYLME
jgi:hypothetical protein